jgi:DnaD/phage-associated family protein
MSPFDGFPEGKVRLTPIPALFFTDLLPQIDQLNELKVVLYAFWRLDRLEGMFRYLRRSDFAGDAQFMGGLEGGVEVERALDEALAGAVRRGVLLKAILALETEETLYFLNTPKGRAAVRAIEQGRWRPSGEPQMPVELALEPPNIYRLYEQNIGPLTPLIAESLREAEAEYPESWVNDAFRIAVENNKRSWRYIEAILRRWQEKGRDEQKGRGPSDRRDTEKDRRRYAQWEE